jgi:hypothetical protein
MNALGTLRRLHLMKAYTALSSSLGGVHEATRAIAIPLLLGFP